MRTLWRSTLQPEISFVGGFQQDMRNGSEVDGNGGVPKIKGFV